MTAGQQGAGEEGAGEEGAGGLGGQSSNWAKCECTQSLVFKAQIIMDNSLLLLCHLTE